LFAALGFAVVENALYAKAFESASLLIALGRGFIASFIHSLMMMIQGTFLMRLVASGWRRWDLPIIGWLLAAAAHAGFDWGMLQPLTVYLTKGGDPMAMEAAVMQALPVLIVGIPAPFIIGLWLFRGALRQAGDFEREHRFSEFDESSAGDLALYKARLARWRRAGNIVMTVGGVVLLGSVVTVIVLSVLMAQRVIAGAAPQPEPQEMLTGTIA